MSTTCPGCGEAKTKRAQVCAKCRRDATQLGVSVLTAVATPAHPFKPRTEMQNRMYHGRIREIALLEKPDAAGGELWSRERKLKKWAVAHASKMVGRELSSSTELSEIEFERLIEWLGDVIDDLHAGRRRPR